MKTSLIQRGKFEDRPQKSGIDNILKFDYMGSSEFEWGALPDSLSRIRKEPYLSYDLTIKGKSLTVFCKISHNTEDVKEYLLNLAANKWYMQEYSDFDNFINPSEHFKSKTDFWWDISNDIMFWRKDEVFESKFFDRIKG